MSTCVGIANSTNTTSKIMATTNGKTNWDEKELGCLWRRETQATKEKYLTGVINLKSLGFDQDVQLICFTNKHKTKDTHPDIRIYLSEKKTGAAKGSAPAAKPAPTKPVAPTPAPQLPQAPDASELI